MLRHTAQLSAFVMALAAALALAACSSRTTDEPSPQGKTSPTSPPTADGAPASASRPGQKEAAQLYNNFCVTCHGPTGRGDGGAAQGLSVRPRDYSDRAWQASITDQALAKVIVEGGGAVGKSVLMPASPALKEKPEVVAELVTLIRSFAAQP